MREIPDEIIKEMQASLAKADSKPMPPEFFKRFKVPGKTLKLSEDGIGLEMVAMSEGTHIMVDFGEPVQVLAMSPRECFGLISILQEVMKTSMVREIVNEATGVKAH